MPTFAGCFAAVIEFFPLQRKREREREREREIKTDIERGKAMHANTVT